MLKPCLEKSNQTQTNKQTKTPQKCQILIKDILFRNPLIIRSDFHTFYVIPSFQKYLFQLPMYLTILIIRTHSEYVVSLLKSG